jgi:uncharacterized linocin/CFP29 family protein
VERLGFAEHEIQREPQIREAREAREAALGRMEGLRRDRENLEAARQARSGEPAFQLHRLPLIWRVTGADSMNGLLDEASELPERRQVPAPDLPGDRLVADISAAVGQLEATGHLGPFGCVLDQEFFNAVQTPNRESLVLPQDRILPFLGGGALLRSSTLPPRTGLVIASGGAPVDLVVGTDISVKFLQVTLEPRFVFRVYERIRLRVKEAGAIIRLR